jgi:hypothetical protein
MSVSRHDPQRSFFDVSFLADNLFDGTDPYSLFRRDIFPALQARRSELEAMYCLDNGRPGIDPVLVAGVTLLQFMEKAPDRRALEQVRYHLGWKHALDLAVGYGGFHATSLVYFRQRLLEHEQARVVFDAILQGLEDKGLIRRRGRQRLDSTHILGLVSSMSRLEMTRETIRLFLRMLERRGQLSKTPGGELLGERYLDSEIPWRHMTKEMLAEKFRQAGQDIHTLIGWVQSRENWDEQDKTGLLKRVFAEQFEVIAGEPQVRKGEYPGAVKNPHDPEAQWAAKDPDKKTAWVGYKVQIAETVPADGAIPNPKGRPTSQFVTEVTTTEAIASDLDGRERVERQQQQHGLGRADTLYVDTAYVTDDALGRAEQEGRELIGPARGSCNTSGEFFTAEAFDVSIAERRAICPAGHASTQCSRLENKQTGQVDYRFEWSYHCDDCPLKSQCTNARRGRRMLLVGQHHDLLQARRRQMKTDEFKRQMHHRKAIEGTISEFVRNGGRRTRYRSLAKTALANYFHGAAVNAKRWIRLLQYRLAVESPASV